MRLLTCLLLLLMGANQLLAAPRSGGCGRKDNVICPKCLAGQYQRGCGCVPCLPGTYTSDFNCEDSCLRCFSDCKPDLHLKVVKKCTNTSNLQCECEDGYTCKKRDELSNNCRSCQPSEKHLTSIRGPSGLQSSTLPQPCRVSNGCSPSSKSGNTTEPRTDTTQNHLIAILCPLLIIGGLALVLILCLGHETRFKQALKQLCTTVETKDSAHQTRETSDQKQQTVPMATANMGPVHVHNPGTVIFSLLGAFSGQIGQAKEEKAEVKEPSEDDACCTVCQPTPSPAFPLSEEDHGGEHVFFPSQEQGKDSHVSMEEQL